MQGGRKAALFSMKGMGQSSSREKGAVKQGTVFPLGQEGREGGQRGRREKA